MTNTIAPRDRIRAGAPPLSVHKGVTPSCEREPQLSATRPRLRLRPSRCRARDLGYPSCLMGAGILAVLHGIREYARTILGGDGGERQIFGEEGGDKELVLWS